MSGEDQDRNLEQRAGEAVAAIDDLIQRLSEVGLSWERLERWEDRGRHIIMEHFGEQEAERFLDVKGEIRMGWPDENFANAIHAKREYLTALKEAVQDDPAAFFAKPVVAPRDPKESPATPSTNRVSLVHGHEEVNLLRLERMLGKYGLQPVILKYEPGKGRTLIEKFEEEAAGCEFAFVLLTPTTRWSTRPRME